MKSGDGRARPLHLDITLQAPEQPILKVAGGSHQGLLQLFEASWEPGQKSGPGEGPGWVTKWARGSWLGDKTWPTAMKARCHIDSIHLDCNVKGAPPDCMVKQPWEQWQVRGQHCAPGAHHTGAGHQSGGGATARQSSPAAARGQPPSLSVMGVRHSHSRHMGPSSEPHTCLSKYYSLPISLLRKLRARLCPAPSPRTQKGRLHFHQGLGQRLPTKRQRMFPVAVLQDPQPQPGKD